VLCIASVDDLRVGDLGFASIKGRVGAGVLAGQTAIDLAALLRGRPVENAGWITHAFVVARTRAGNADIVEAMPSGARQVLVSQHCTTGPHASRIGPGFAYVRLPNDAGPIGWMSATADAALEMVGTPYGFAQYAALAALTLSGGDHADRTGPLARYVDRRRPDGRPEQAICSQLVDEVLRVAGVHLFDDGRPPQYVTPGALFWRAAQLGEVCIC
jgi:hypothetical protein